LPLVDPLSGRVLGTGALLGRLDEDASNSVLANVGRFLGRPGFAIRSLLRGNPIDALENVAQGLLDLPTGGFIDRRLSLANLLPESVQSGGDITTRAERPEFTDLVGGFTGPGKVLADVVGGIATDPLTLATFGGSGVARGALGGLRRTDAARGLSVALRETAAGRRALEEAASEIGRKATAKLGDAALTPAARGALTRRVEELAAEKVLTKHVDPALFDDLFRTQKAKIIRDGIGKLSDEAAELAASNPGELTALAASAAKPSVSRELTRLEALANARAGRIAGVGRRTGPVISGAPQQADIVEAGVRALENVGLLKDSSALRIGGVSVIKDFWPRIGRMTILRPFVKKPGREAETILQAGAEAAWQWAKGALFDKTLIGKVPAGLREVARRHGLERARKDATSAHDAQRLFGHFTGEEKAIMGRGLMAAQDEWHKVLRGSGDASRFTGDMWDAMLEGIKREIPEKADEVEAAMGGFALSMERVQQDLVKLGVWDKAVANPFYIPLQAADDVAEWMAKGAHNEGFRVALKDVFTKRRKFETLEEFQEALRKVATKHGVDVTPEELVNPDIGNLFFRRMQAHNTTVQRVRTANEAKRRFGARPGTAEDKYVQAVLAPLAPKNFFNKIMSGGKLRINVGDETRSLNWAGVNFFIKAPLTVLFPAFHARNATSAVWMGLMDPDIGFAGVSGLVRSVRDGRIARALVGESQDDMAKMLRALWDPSDANKAALEGIKVGTWTGREIVDQAAGAVVGGKFTSNEVLRSLPERLGETARTSPKILGDIRSVLAGEKKVSGILRSAAQGDIPLYNKAVDLGRDISNLVEDSFRLSGYIALIKKGRTPTEAARRVAKAYVDYDVVSNVERFIRDVFPFARFQIGNTPVALQAIARRPRIVTPFLTAQRSATGDEQGFLPDRIRDTLAIPIGKDQEGKTRFLTNLGLPFESALPNLGLLAGPVGLGPRAGRRQVLSSLNPVFKTPLEAITNRNFFFGDEFAKFRKAPSFAPPGFPGVTEFVDKQGVKRREVPGWVNAWLIGALPTSRMVRTADKWLDSNRGFAQNLADTATGLQIKNVDHEREVRRAIKEYLVRAADRGEIGQIERFFEFDGKEAPEEIKAALGALAAQQKARRK